MTASGGSSRRSNGTAKRVDDLVVRTFFEAHRAIESTGLLYAVMGGYALNAWGVPRATFDFDFAVLAQDGASERVLEALAGARFDVPREYREGYVQVVDGTKMLKAFALLDGCRVAPVDVFLFASPLQRSALARRQPIEVLGRGMWVISAADLLLFKLLAYRGKDRIDVLNVLEVQGVPDPEYVRDWARRLGIEERFDEALEATGLAG